MKKIKLHLKSLLSPYSSNSMESTFHTLLEFNKNFYENLGSMTTTAKPFASKEMSMPLPPHLQD